jgi:hypothetical protein
MSSASRANASEMSPGSRLCDEDGCIFSRIKALNRPFSEKVSSPQPPYRASYARCASDLPAKSTRGTRAACGARLGADENEQRRSERRLLRKKLSNLAYVCVAAKGLAYTAPDFVEATEHARKLAEKSGNLTQLVLQVVGMWASANISGDIPASTTFADQALDLAQRDGSPASLALAHMAQIGSRYLRADLVGAAEYFVRDVELFAAAGFRRVPGSVAFTFGVASLNAWALGRADTARERIRQAIAGGGENNSPL